MPHPPHTPNLSRAWEALLADFRHEDPLAQVHMTRLISLQLDSDAEQLWTRWLEEISKVLPHETPLVSHEPRVAEALHEHLPAHTIHLSDLGKLRAWCAIFSTRADIKSRQHLSPSTRTACDGGEEPADYRALTLAFERFEFEWRFERHALRQSHIVPQSVLDHFSSHTPSIHGRIALEARPQTAWREEVYPNNWKTIDYHARESLRIGLHGTYDLDEIYLVTAEGAPRSEAYVVAATSVDGGNFGGIPACKAQTRYRDLATFLRMGVGRGFAEDWTILVPEDQDFGAFAEVERQIYIPEYFARDPEEDALPCSPVEEVLRLRSAPRDLGEHELRTRLMERGASHFITEQLWQWLAEDIRLLIEK